MTAASDSLQATPPHGVNWSLKPLKESTRLTMVKHESEFKHKVSLDTDEPMVPETMNQSMAKGKEVDHAMSAAEASSTLYWFAKIATFVKDDVELALFLERERVVGNPIQQGDCLEGVKGKRKHKRMETKKCISSWGNIQKGKRSKRVRDRNPLSTFLRGGLLCIWR